MHIGGHSVYIYIYIHIGGIYIYIYIYIRTQDPALAALSETCSGERVVCGMGDLSCTCDICIQRHTHNGNIPTQQSHTHSDPQCCDIHIHTHTVVMQAYPFSCHTSHMYSCSIPFSDPQCCEIRTHLDPHSCHGETHVGSIPFWVFS